MKKQEPKKNGRPKEYTKERIEKLADELITWFEQPTNFWLKDFALSKGFHWQSFIESGKENKKFSDALKRAKDMQESKLVKMGFSKKFNPAMAIFALKNTAGWRDKQDITTDGQALQLISKVPRPELSNIAVAEDGLVTTNGHTNGNGTH